MTSVAQASTGAATSVQKTVGVPESCAMPHGVVKLASHSIAHAELHVHSARPSLGHGIATHELGSTNVPTKWCPAAVAWHASLVVSPDAKHIVASVAHTLAPWLAQELVVHSTAPDVATAHTSALRHVGATSKAPSSHAAPAHRATLLEHELWPGTPP